MNNKHSVMLLISLCISKSQIVVHGPQFRFTEDFCDPWKSWQSSWDWLRLFAASYFDRCPCSSLLQRTGGPWKQLGVKKNKQKPNKTQEHAATTMQAGSTKALISKDISSQQKYSSSTLVSHTLYFCVVQFKAGLQHSSLPAQRKAVPTIDNLLAAQGSLLHVLRAGWKHKCPGEQNPTAREAAVVQGTPH